MAAHAFATVPLAPVVPKLRVLIIDDDAAVGRGLLRVLHREFDCTIETSPTVALRRAQAEDFDVILCDLHMPEMSGIKFCERLRRDRPVLASHLILATGGLLEGEATEVAAMNCPTMEKPFDFNALREAIKKAA